LTSVHTPLEIKYFPCIYYLTFIVAILCFLGLKGFLMREYDVPAFAPKNPAISNGAYCSKKIMHPARLRQYESPPLAEP